MNTFSVVHAGILATAAMTALLYLAAWLTHANVKVVKILGTMLTHQTQKDGACSNNFLVIGIGMLVHYLVGIGFAIAYWLLISYRLLTTHLQDTLLFGCAIGTVAIIVWGSYLKLHPQPPRVPMALYLFLIFTGHLILALVLQAFMREQI